MVGRQYDCLTNPLGAVRFTFAKALISGSDPASFDLKDWGVADIFRDFLFDNDGLNQVLPIYYDKCNYISRVYKLLQLILYASIIVYIVDFRVCGFVFLFSLLYRYY